MVAGSLSSGLSSAITTPFDVVKTRFNLLYFKFELPILISYHVNDFYVLLFF